MMPTTSRRAYRRHGLHRQSGDRPGQPRPDRAGRDRRPEAIEQPDFIVSDDPWFRPVDIELGPDGALYIADFYNRIIGHYEVPLTHPGRDRERGPDLADRLRRRGRRCPPAWMPRPDWGRASVDDLVDDLDHPNLAVRMRAPRSSSSVPDGSRSGRSVRLWRSTVRPSGGCTVCGPWSVEGNSRADRLTAGGGRPRSRRPGPRNADARPSGRIGTPPCAVASSSPCTTPTPSSGARPPTRWACIRTRRKSAPCSMAARPPTRRTRISSMSLRMALRDQLRGDAWAHLPDPLTDRDRAIWPTWPSACRRPRRRSSYSRSSARASPQWRTSLASLSTLPATEPATPRPTLARSLASPPAAT